MHFSCTKYIPTSYIPILKSFRLKIDTILLVMLDRPSFKKVLIRLIGEFHVCYNFLRRYVFCDANTYH